MKVIGGDVDEPMIIIDDLILPEETIPKPMIAPLKVKRKNPVTVPLKSIEVKKIQNKPPARIIPQEIREVCDIIQESTDGNEWIQVVNEKDIVFYKKSVSPAQQ